MTDDRATTIDRPFTGSRIGRRAFLRRALGAGLMLSSAAPLLAACGGDDDDDEDGAPTATSAGDVAAQTPTESDDETDTPEDDEPTATPEANGGQGGTLIIDLGSEPENLDPHQQLAATTALINMQTFDSLLSFELDSLELIPWLAESWESTEDGMAWTYTLRQGVQFHDGTDFDAEAVKFNYDRVFDPDNEYNALGSWSSAPFYDFVSDVTVDGPHTVTFTLNSFINSALQRLGFFTPVSPAGVETHREAFTENPVGTGPYQFDRWDKGQQVVLKRFDDYWLKRPGLDQVVFKAIAESGARGAALLGGEVHLAVEISPEIAVQIEADDNLTVMTGPTGAIWFLAMNVESEAFTDVRVRQAVNLAVDKQTIVEGVLNNTVDIAHGPLAPAYIHYNPKVEEYFSYDPDRARELLQEAGFTEEMEIVFRSSIGGSGMLSPEEMATVIQDNLRAVGMTTRLEVTEFVSWMDAIRNPQNELTVMSWNLAPTEPDYIFNGFLSEASLPPGFNTSYWVNEEFERLIVTGRTSLDPDEVKEVYFRAQEIVMEEAPIVPVCHRQQLFGVSNRVQNFQVAPSMGLYLYDVWME